VPFGFTRGEGAELIPHDGQQKAIREMKRLRAQGKAPRPIAEAMRAKGHKISHEGVAGVLKAARVWDTKGSALGSGATG
jgi:hypothetical protein